MIIDLHLHSTASDGTWTPTEVVRQAAQGQVQAMALTDHDTLAGAPEAMAEAERQGIRFVFGVELNTDAGGAEIDILGYFLQEPPSRFKKFLKARQAARIERARAIVARLNDLNLPVDYKRVRELARGVVARPHIAQAMIEKGYARTQREVYNQYIGFGAPAYVERDKLHPADGIEYVKSAGGVAIVAHPGLVGDDTAVEALIDSGADGLEAYYAFHTPEQILKWKNLSQKRHLLITAGSDAHGPGRAKSEAVGVPVADDLWNVFEHHLVERWTAREPSTGSGEHPPQ